MNKIEIMIIGKDFMFFSIKAHNYTKFLLMSVVTMAVSSDFFDCYAGTGAPSSSNSDKEIASDFLDSVSQNQQANKKEDVLSFSDIVGDNFIFSNEKGFKFSFSNLKGHVLVIAFSTTWCPNCPVVLKSLDVLKKKLLQQEIYNVGVITLNIGDEDIKAVKDHYAEYGIENLSAYESVAHANGIEGVPVCFVFDKEGKQAAKYLGWHDFASDDFIAFLKKLAAKKVNDYSSKKKGSTIGSGKVWKKMEVLKYGNPILKKKCAPVEVGDKEAPELLEQMLQQMYESDGVGLAAPQVGISKRMVVIDVRQEPAKVYKMINPKIVWKSEETAELIEGCLSVPGVYETVKRPASVSVEYLDETFKPCFIEKATGILAACLQHEIDHLDGKLYVDHLSRIKRARLISKYKKLQEQQEPISDNSGEGQQAQQQQQ